MSIKSFKDFKNKSFRKTAMVPLNEEYSLPLKSLSVLEQVESIDLGVKPPTKLRKMTKEEKEEYLKDNPNVNEALIAQYRVAYIDETDKEYLDKLKEHNNIKTLLNYVKYIDLKFKIDKTELWKDLGLKNDKDYIGLVNLMFKEWELGEDVLKKMAVSINALQGDPLFVKLSKLENLYKDKSMFDLVEIINKEAEKANGAE